MSVKSWINGSQVWGELVAVRGLQLCPAGKKLPQITITVFDASGARTATSWSLPPSQVEIVTEAVRQSPPLLRVSGTVDSSEKYAGQLKITGVTHVSTEEAETVDEHYFLELLPPNHAQMIVGLDHLINRVKQPYLASLLKQTIGHTGSLRARFLEASAAKGNHHAYPGGLLQHSLEVTEIALHTARHFPKMHPDLLITAGLLHDVGKLWEMDHAWRRGEYTDAGNLLGHIYLGAERIGAICRGLKFPEPLRIALTHAILAHHDEQQFGSPMPPKTAEAIVLAKCDQISAEITAFFQAKQASSLCQRTATHGGRFLFIGDLSLGVPEALGLTERFLSDDPEDRLLRRLAGKDMAFQNFGITAALPILGTVAAGDGIQSSSEETEPDTRETLLPPDGASFLLHVTGDSMKDAGIFPDDLLVVRAQETAKVGQIVVAYVPGTGAVVKRLAETSEGRFLASENPAYEPIPIGEEVRIQGIVVRVERDLA